MLDWLGGRSLGVPVSTLIMIVLFALFVLISRKTALGAGFLPLAVMLRRRSCAASTLVGCAFLSLPFGIISGGDRHFVAARLGLVTQVPQTVWS